MSEGVSIHDGTIHGVGLTFDLAEILAAIGPVTRGASWQILDVNYVADEDVSAFHTLHALRTDEIVEAANQVDQVIDGTFEATCTHGTIRVVAVDSSWWEVWSTMPAVLELIRLRFLEVRPASSRVAT